MSGEWTTDCCGCFEDPMNCFVTYFFPCITFGQNAEIIDKGTTSCAAAGALCVCLGLCGLQSCYTCVYRGKLRDQYGIPGNACDDFCIHFWFSACAFCQEHRELQNRGLDPSKGWVAMADMSAPTAPSGMAR